MAYVVTPADRESFKRCRRAWDLGSSRRYDYEPVQRPWSSGLDRAVRDALAVWYFPGMWEWDRAIVRPLALAGFTRSMDDHRAAMSADGEEIWEDDRAGGRRLLERYFDWAPSVDDFSPLRVETDFRVRLPDPRRPGNDLADPRGEPVEYEGRIDLLVVDGEDRNWMVQHRTVAGEWAQLHDLLLEERTTSFCWAWEQYFLGMRISGVVYNELRPPDHDDAVVARRTHRVAKSRHEVAAAGARLADEAMEMTDPGTRVYPNPSPRTSASCVFRAPCVAIDGGRDTASAMAGSYRRRGSEELQEGRLGGVTWSMGRGAAPPRFGAGRPAGG